MSSQTGMGHDTIVDGGLPSANIGGATYQFTDNFVAGVAASDVDDHFKKQYLNANYTLPINDEQSLNFDFNGYKSKSQGQELSGDIDNRIWSLAAAYSIGAHKFTLAHQRSTGDTGYVYGVDGGGTIFLANSVQYSDFNGADERSWQGRYDLNMKTYGVPGLSFMTRYIKGDNISTGAEEGKEHELDFETKYVMQNGPAKDLSFRLRSAWYRSNTAYNGGDNNDLRLIVEYPLSIL
jgi:imipenem/basic amino acid-specific outer membrane pore